MSDHVIQKLYNLEPEKLSYFICTAVFGYVDTYGLEKSDEMRKIYQTEIEIKPEQKFIVKTYHSYYKDEWGEAFVLAQEFKDGTNSIKNLIVVAEDDYIDLSQFKLGDIIPPNSKDFFSLVAGIDLSNRIEFYAKDYNFISFDDDASRIGQGRHTITYSAASGALENSAWLNNSRTFPLDWLKDFKNKAEEHTTLNYIKSNASRTTFAMIYAKTRSNEVMPEPNMVHDSDRIVNITFIPRSQAEMLLFGK